MKRREKFVPEPQIDRQISALFEIVPHIQTVVPGLGICGKRQGEQMSLTCEMSGSFSTWFVRQRRDEGRAFWGGEAECDNTPKSPGSGRWRFKKWFASGFLISVPRPNWSGS